MAETRMALNANLHTDQTTQRATGVEFQRRFTDGKVHPFDRVEWERRTALIGNDKGQVIFRQENVEVPKGWSQTATNIVASKYLHGKLGSPERVRKDGAALVGGDQLDQDPAGDHVVQARNGQVGRGDQGADQRAEAAICSGGGGA